MTLPPEICCQTCCIAAQEPTRNAYDFKCAECVARYLMHMAQSLGERFGGVEHARRVKDLLAEKLIGEA